VASLASGFAPEETRVPFFRYFPHPMPVPLHLEFELGADRYLLPVARVEAVLPLPVLKALPGAPEGVAGVFNHRGRAVPVVDLARLALGRAAEDRRSTRLVLVRFPTRTADRTLGLIVEGATTVRRAAEDEFQDAGAVAATWLGGVAPAPGIAGLAQRVEVEGLLPPGIREALFQVADLVLAEGGT
jgi:chemotaxis-related protein WspB